MYWLTYFFEEPIYINFGTWISLGDININYGILLDSLSMVVMVPVGIVTLAVLIYALDYMRHDPNRNRFYIILSVFALFMTILVVSENYVMMFIGWEFVGVISYLLISFWNTRIAAMKSALSAILLNRMGDTLFVICIGCMLSFFHAVDFNTIELLVPHVDTSILNSLAIMLLIAATAKSAQLGLHGWLLSAMEGDAENNQQYKYDKYYKSYHNYTHNKKFNKINNNLATRYISIRNYSHNRKLVYVYDIYKNILLNNKHYDSISECSNELKFTRGTIRKYLDSNKIYKQQYLFSSKLLTNKELSIYNKYDNNLFNIITGEMLGDGHIRLITTLNNEDNTSKLEPKARLEFTFKLLEYVNYLKFNVLKDICNNTPPTPWPKEDPSQYWFSSLSLPIIYDLHKQWYRLDENNKYIKKLPDNIYDLLTPIGLAHWYMGDGFFNNGNKCTYFCTDNFTLDEVELLIDILKTKFNINSSYILRSYTNSNNIRVTHYRIKIDLKESINFINIIKPYIIPCMLYKINIK